MASPIAAAILSIIPGLGQMYAGKWRRGLALFFGLSAQAALFHGVVSSYVLASGWSVFSSMLIALCWLWNIADAWIVARGSSFSTWPLALLLVIVNFVAGWVVTDIHSPDLGKEQRNVIRRILGGLASPDFAAQRTRTNTAMGKYIVPGPGAPTSLDRKPVQAHKPRVALSPTVAQSGQRVAVTGRDFAPDADGMLVLLGANEIEVGSFHTDKRGRFATTFDNPRGVPGSYFVRAQQVVPIGGYSISETMRDDAPRMLETIYLALVGTALSLIFAIPLSFFGARNLMSAARPLRVIYALTRGLFTILRSVEVLIIAVIAIAAVGIGPFAGVIALAIHGIGALGKLYSEAIESIEHGPIEATRATGASELQVVIYGVIPQVVPQFIAFTLYRWDINVRMATVIGLVGGGGIGYQLIQYMNLMQWRQAATCIWLIAGVVMLMDYVSAVVREKIV